MPTDKNYWKPDRVVYRRKPQKHRALFNKTRLIVIGYLAVIALVYWGAYLLLHLAYFRITTIQVEGSRAISADDIKGAIAPKISGDWWYLVPKNNILFFSTAATERALQKDFPALKTVSVEKHFPHDILGSFSERELWAIYCRVPAGFGNATSTVETSVPRQCFFIDHGGTLFREAPEVEGSLILTFAADDPAPIGMGSRRLTPEEILRFESLSKILREQAGIAVSGFEFRENSPDDVWVITSAGYAIIVTKSDDFEKVAEVIKAVLDNEIRDRILRLDYIDARFGNKVFVKYR